MNLDSNRSEKWPPLKLQLLKRSEIKKFRLIQKFKIKLLYFDIQNNSASEEEIAKDENVEAGQGDQGDDGKSKKNLFFYFFAKPIFLFIFTVRGRQSKSEKKARKAMAKLSLRAIPGVNRVCIRLSLLIFYDYFLPCF